MILEYLILKQVIGLILGKTIEMKQIGLREEASRLGGIGSCGRELCCSTWLTDFRSVTTSAARYQQLSLNPQKLAGQCGKLKCCLKNYATSATKPSCARTIVSIAASEDCELRSVGVICLGKAFVNVHVILGEAVSSRSLITTVNLS